jgi:hypothetical protein
VTPLSVDIYSWEPEEVAINVLPSAEDTTSVQLAYIGRLAVGFTHVAPLSVETYRPSYVELAIK